MIGGLGGVYREQHAECGRVLCDVERGVGRELEQYVHEQWEELGGLVGVDLALEQKLLDLGRQLLHDDDDDWIEKVWLDELDEWGWISSMQQQQQQGVERRRCARARCRLSEVDREGSIAHDPLSSTRYRSLAHQQLLVTPRIRSCWDGSKHVRRAWDGAGSP